ncbi:MAG: hypothetical protein GYA24_08085 [Candidatus Lokiarchaeota archaeon]|nr:hypothetical protein [Candidatus Lokiarchaeota archaeon]
MSRDNDSLYKNPRMKLRENICKEYEHFSPDTMRRIKDCRKALGDMPERK